MEAKKIVIALGGNALGNDVEEQKEAVAKTAKVIVDLAEEGYQMIVTHGNGPQVGMIQNAMDEFDKDQVDSKKVPLTDKRGNEPGIYWNRSAECNQI